MGDNYIVWSHFITIALIAKNNVGFIDGSITTPLTDQHINHIAWLRANNLILSWLINSISKDICNNLLYIVSTIDLWNELKTRCLRSDGPRFFHLEISLGYINQGSSSIIEYSSAIKILWDEYVSYRPYLTCTCDLFNFVLL